MGRRLELILSGKKLGPALWTDPDLCAQLRKRLIGIFKSHVWNPGEDHLHDVDVPGAVDEVIASLRKSKYNGRSTVKTYLARAVTYRLSTQRRSFGRRRRLGNGVSPEPEGCDPPAGADSDPVAQALASEIRTALCECLEQLAPPCGELLRLSLFGPRKYVKLAMKLLDMDRAATVHERVRVCKRKLRDCLRGRGLCGTADD